MRSQTEGHDPSYLPVNGDERTAARISRLEARVSRLEQASPVPQTTGAPTDVAPVGAMRIDPFSGTVYFSRGAGSWRAV